MHNLRRRKFLEWLIGIPFVSAIAKHLPESENPATNSFSELFSQSEPLSSWVRRALLDYDPDITFLHKGYYSEEDWEFLSSWKPSQVPWACVGDFDADGRSDVAVLCELRGRLKLFVVFARPQGVVVQEADDVGKIAPGGYVDCTIYTYGPSPVILELGGSSTKVPGSIHVGSMEACGYVVFLEHGKFGDRWVQVGDDEGC